jgi:HK97 family phage portal protein
MGIFNRNKQNNTESRSIIEGVSSLFGVGYTGSTGSISEKQSMQLSAVYRCVDVISDSVASVDVEPLRRLKDGSKIVDYVHPTYNAINISPNKIQSRYTFFKQLIVNMLLKGNGYVWLIRDNDGNVMEQRLVNPDLVTVVYNSNNHSVSYLLKGSAKSIESDDMIHILNFSYDGLVGVSTLTHALNATSTARAEDLHAKGFFSGGSNLSGILKVNGAINEEKAKKIKAAWTQAFDTETGSPNGIAVLEGNMDFQAVQISPAEAQMLESRQFSVIEIGRFFGVSPQKLFDTKSSTYSNVESAQLAFITDTLFPIISKLEAEYNRKFFRPSERTFLEINFDLQTLLRADMNSMADYYQKMFMVGAYSVNEIRSKIGNKLSSEPNANIPFIQSSMIGINHNFEPDSKQDNNSK